MGTNRRLVTVISAGLLMTILVFLPLYKAEAQPDYLMSEAMPVLEQASTEKLEVHFNDQLGTISWLKGSFDAGLPQDPRESAYRFMEAHPDVFRISSPRDEFSELSSKVDKQLGTRHVYFDQEIDGVKVWGHRLGFHFDRDGKINIINGRYNQSEILLSTVPSLRPVDAIEAAIAALKSLSYKGIAGAERGLLSGAIEYGPVIFNDAIAPSAELVFYPDTAGDLNLSYLVRLSVDSPPGAWLFFVDALNGRILHWYNNVQSAGTAVGSGIDLKGNSVTLNTYLDVDNKYKLIDASKYMKTHSPTAHPNTSFQGVIEVRDANHAVDGQGQPLDNTNYLPVSDPNNDNIFDDNNNADPKANYRAAVSLARGFSETYDFLYNILGRNSIDNNGLSMVGNVHHGSNYANGYWRGDLKMIFFGDSDKTWPYTRGKDWVAHETGHGVTQYEVPPNGFVYQNQSGGLNEAYSDFLAMAVDYDDWDFGGETADLVPSRYMNDPTTSNPPQPKDMYKLFMSPIEIDNGGVHYNSGIGNYAFYLISTALPAVSPAADGRITAYKIAYRAYTYLTANPNATFKDWGTAMKQAAIDLFGPGAEYTAVVNALNTTHISQASVAQWDTGHVAVKNNQADYWVIGQSRTDKCFSVLFNRPSADSVLKALEIPFLYFYNTAGANATYSVYVCNELANHYPDEQNCLKDTPLVSSAHVQSGEFTIIPCNVSPLPSKFHAMVCFPQGNDSYIQYLIDDGTANSGTSFVYGYIAGNSTDGWYRPTDYGYTNNIMMRAIFEEPAAGAAPAAPVLVGPANGSKVSATQATFTWNASNGADRYFLEVNSSNAWTPNTRKFFAGVNTTSQTVTGLPNDGTTFYWRVYAGTVDAWSAASGTFSFTNGDAPVTHTITTSATPNGSGTVTCVPNPVNHGSNSICTVAPAAGYHVGSVTVDNNAATLTNGTTYTFTNVTTTHSISVTFAVNTVPTYTITTSASPNGSGTVVCVPNPVNQGSNSTCTVTPAAGYHVNTVTVDNNAATLTNGTTYTFTNVTTTHNISVVFAINTHTITTSATPNGSGTVTCVTNPVNHGSNSICTVAPAAGYHVGSVTVDGNAATLTNGTTYTFTNVTATHNISVVFAAVSCSVTFGDVPADYWAADYVKKLACNNITSGCGGGNYCPESLVTRAQMAVFVVKALGQQPVATCTGTVFNDVNANMNGGEGFCRYIEKFRELNITAGCAVNNPNTPQNEAAYCPDNNVTRAQMAVFLTKALAQQPAATCTGTVFNDVNATMNGGDAFCRYIEKFRALNITSGCVANNPNTPQNEAAYCPDNDVTRAQMAVFLTKGFLQ